MARTLILTVCALVKSHRRQPIAVERRMDFIEDDPSLEDSAACCCNGQAQWACMKTKRRLREFIVMLQTPGAGKGYSTFHFLPQDFHLTINQLCILGSSVSWGISSDLIGFTP